MNILQRDLCARLPYKVKVRVKTTVNGDKIEHTGVLNGFRFDQFGKLYVCVDGIEYNFEDIKPCLRPMSSMTEEEQNILEDFGVTISPFSGQMHVPFDEIEFPFITMQKIISYLYSIHIDINGLIPKGLAIEVTEDNNICK